VYQLLEEMLDNGYVAHRTVTSNIHSRSASVTAVTCTFINSTTASMCDSGLGGMWLRLHHTQSSCSNPLVVTCSPHLSCTVLATTTSCSRSRHTSWPQALRILHTQLTAPPTLHRYPLATEPNILREMIRPPTWTAVFDSVTGEKNVKEKLPTGVTTNTQWRRAGVKYSSNEAFVDILENVSGYGIVTRVPRLRSCLRFAF
jgi:hypothetical protein